MPDAPKVTHGSVFTTFESRSCIRVSRSYKVRWALPPREVWGYVPPDILKIVDPRRRIFQHSETQNLILKIPTKVKYFVSF